MSVTWGSDTEDGAGNNNVIPVDPDDGGLQVDRQVIGSFFRTADGTGRRDVLASKNRITMNFSAMTQTEKDQTVKVFAAKASAANTLTVTASETWSVIGISLNYTAEDTDNSAALRYAMTIVCEEA